MPSYPALFDGKKGAYGITFPDLPGIVAMGQTVDKAILNAKKTLTDHTPETQANNEAPIPPTPLDAVATPDGQTLASIPLIFPPRHEAPAP